MADPKEFVIDEKLMEKCRLMMEWFKCQTLEKIAKRLHHGDWSDKRVYELFLSLEGEVRELKEVADEYESHTTFNNSFHPDLFRIIDECNDVAFTAAMIADVAREKIKAFIMNGGKNG